MSKSTLFVNNQACHYHQKAFIIRNQRFLSTHQKRANEENLGQSRSPHSSSQPSTCIDASKKSNDANPCYQYRIARREAAENHFSNTSLTKIPARKNGPSFQSKNPANKICHKKPAASLQSIKSDINRFGDRAKNKSSSHSRTGAQLPSKGSSLRETDSLHPNRQFPSSLQITHASCKKKKKSGSGDPAETAVDAKAKLRRGRKQSSTSVVQAEKPLATKHQSCSRGPEEKMINAKASPVVWSGHRSEGSSTAQYNEKNLADSDSLADSKMSAITFHSEPNTSAIEITSRRLNLKYHAAAQYQSNLVGPTKKKSASSKPMTNTLPLGTDFVSKKLSHSVEKNGNGFACPDTSPALFAKISDQTEEGETLRIVKRHFPQNAVQTLSIAANHDLKVSACLAKSSVSPEVHITSETKTISDSSNCPRLRLSHLLKKKTASSELGDRCSNSLSEVSLYSQIPVQPRLEVLNENQFNHVLIRKSFRAPEQNQEYHNRILPLKTYPAKKNKQDLHQAQLIDGRVQSIVGLCNEMSSSRPKFSAEEKSKDINEILDILEIPVCNDSVSDKPSLFQQLIVKKLSTEIIQAVKSQIKKYVTDNRCPNIYRKADSTTSASLLPISTKSGYVENGTLAECPFVNTAIQESSFYSSQQIQPSDSYIYQDNSLLFSQNVLQQQCIRDGNKTHVIQTVERPSQDIAPLTICSSRKPLPVTSLEGRVTDQCQVATCPQVKEEEAPPLPIKNSLTTIVAKKYPPTLSMTDSYLKRSSFKSSNTFIQTEQPNYQMYNSTDNHSTLTGTTSVFDEALRVALLKNNVSGIQYSQVVSDDKLLHSEFFTNILLTSSNEESTATSLDNAFQNEGDFPSTTPGQQEDSDSLVQINRSLQCLNNQLVTMIQDRLDSLKTQPMQLSPQCYPENTLMIWDWDDTFLPTYYITMESSHPILSNLSPEITTLIQRLEEKALRSLKLSMRYSSAMFLTNASYRWFADSASKYLPNLWSFLMENKVKILSARDVCQRLNIVQSEWKRLLIRDQVESFFSHLQMDPREIETATNCIRKCPSQVLFSLMICSTSELIKVVQDLAQNMDCLAKKSTDSAHGAKIIQDVQYAEKKDSDEGIHFENIDLNNLAFYLDERNSQSSKLDRFCRSVSSILQIDLKVFAMAGLLLQENDGFNQVHSSTTTLSQNTITDLERNPVSERAPASSNLVMPAFNELQNPGSLPLFSDFRKSDNLPTFNDFQISGSISDGVLRQMTQESASCANIRPLCMQNFSTLNSSVHTNCSDLRPNDFYALLQEEYNKKVSARLGKRSSQETIWRHQANSDQLTIDNIPSLITTASLKAPLDGLLSSQAPACSENSTSVLCLSEHNNCKERQVLVIPSINDSDVEILGGLLRVTKPYAILGDEDIVVINNMFPPPSTQLGLKLIPCSVISIGDGESEREAALATMAQVALNYRLMLNRLEQLRNLIHEEFFIPFFDYCAKLMQQLRIESLHRNEKQSSMNVAELKTLEVPWVAWTFKSIKLQTRPSLHQLYHTHCVLSETLPLLIQLDHNVDAMIPQAPSYCEHVRIRQEI